MCRGSSLEGSPDAVQPFRCRPGAGREIFRQVKPVVRSAPIVHCNRTGVIEYVGAPAECVTVAGRAFAVTCASRL